MVNNMEMDSILKTVKKGIGIDPSYKTAFDSDLVMYINSALSTLTQLGVGPNTGFSITGPDEKWSDLLGNDKRLNLVQSYITLQVKLLFDAPQNASLYGVIKDELAKLEWRINVAVDPGDIV